MAEYPDGKLNKDDLGAWGATVYIEKGRVVIDFGKDLSWVALEKNTLRILIDILEGKYKQL